MPPSPSPSPSPSSSSSHKSQGLSDEETKKKAKGTIEEFYSVGDLKEVVTCVAELKDKRANLAVVVEVWLSDMLESKNRSADRLSQLMQHVCEHKPSPMTSDDVAGGMVSVICMLEDLCIDVPKAPAMLSVVLGDLAAKNLVTLGFLGAPLDTAFEEFTGDKRKVVEQEKTYTDFVALVAKRMLTEGGKQAEEIKADFASAKVFLPEFT